MAWQKPSYKLPKRADRPFKKRPDTMNSLVGGALQRHGIGKQVEAAMVVKRANELLYSMVGEQYHVDIRVLSFQTNVLHVACRHAPARYMVESVQKDVCQALTADIPAVTIANVFCRIDPHALDSRSEIT